MQYRAGGRLFPGGRTLADEQIAASRERLGGRRLAGNGRDVEPGEGRGDPDPDAVKRGFATISERFVAWARTEDAIRAAGFDDLRTLIWMEYAGATS